MSDLSVEKICTKFVRREGDHENAGTRSASMSIRGDCLYSYNTAVARWVGGTVLVTRETYSNTTGKQMSTLSSALHKTHTPTIYVWDVRAGHSNQAGLWYQELDLQWDSVKRMRARSDRWLGYIGRIITIIGDIRKYNHVAGSCIEIPPMPDLTEYDALMKVMLESLISGNINMYPWIDLCQAYGYADTAPLTDMLTKWGEKINGNTTTRAKPQQKT